MRRLLEGVAAVALVLSSWSCSPEITCGPGTRKEADTCVLAGGGPLVTCGPGTREESGRCVPGSGLSCGAGTHEDAGQCVPDSTGGGTTCGTGTHLDGTQCVPDATLVCGAGTHLEGARCLPGDPIDSITIAPATASVRIGGKLQLAAVARWQGAVVDGVLFTWTASPSSNLSVSPDGLVTGLAAGAATVTAGAQGVTSEAAAITVEDAPAMEITARNPTSGPRGMPLVITGTGFGAAQEARRVELGGEPATEVLSWSDTQLVVRVPGTLPSSAGAVDIEVVDGAFRSNAMSFTVTGVPYVTSVSPRDAPQRTLLPLVIRGYGLVGATTVSALKGGGADAEIAIDMASLVVTPGAGGAPDELRLKAEVKDVATPGPRVITVGAPGGASTSTASEDNALSVSIERGNIETVAGNGLTGTSGDGGKATSANLNAPAGLWAEGGLVFVSDTGNHCVRVINRGKAARAVAGRSVLPGNIDLVAGICGAPGATGDGGTASAAKLNGPRGLLALPSTTLLVIADALNHKLRVVNYGAAASTWGKTTVPAGQIATLAGDGAAAWAGDGSAYDASGVSLNQPTALAYDAARKLLYVADTQNHRVRVLNGNPDPAAVSGSTVGGYAIGPVAGNGTPGSDGDSDFALLAKLNAPQGLAVDGRGVLYVADTNGNRVRAVNPGESDVTLGGIAGETGVTLPPGRIATVAGTGSPGSGTGHAAANTLAMNKPMGLAAEALGLVYVAGQVDSVARLVNMADGPVRRALRPGDHASAGNLVAQSWSRVVAGSTAGFGGDHGLATDAKLSGPKAVALDGGDLYIADTDNHRVRRVLVQWPSAPLSGALGAFPALGNGQAVLNTDTGVFVTADGASVYTGERSGVFSFASIRVPPALTLRLVGNNPAVLGASGAIEVDGTIRTPSRSVTEAPYEPVPGTVTDGPATGYSSICDNGTFTAAHAARGRMTIAQATYRTLFPHGPALVPLAGGGAMNGNLGGGAIGLMAQGPVTVSGTIEAMGKGTYGVCWSSPITYGGRVGAGGGVRVVSATSITVSGAIKAYGEGGVYGGGTARADGRIRLEAPSVVTAGSSITPAAVVSTELGPLPGL